MRRAQIIDCAIDVIADLGYAQASLAQIARRLGISKGVISYYFTSKEELIRQIVSEVISAAGVYMKPHLNDEATASGRLRTYIQLSMEHMRTYPKHVLALVEILSNFRSKEGKLHLDIIADDRLLIGLEDILTLGQQNGEFRSFSVRVMALSIQSSINGVLGRWVMHPDLDLELCGQELATLFDLATRQHPDVPDQS